MLLQDHCEAVSTAPTRDEFQRALVRFAQELGFDTISASAIYDQPNSDTEALWVDNTPAAYRPIFEDRTRGRKDPVMQHCKHTQLPIIWDQSTYVRANFGEQWEIQAAHGYCAGIAMALHLPQGKHLLIGADRDSALPIHRPDQMTRMVADLASLLMAAHDNAFWLLPPSDPKGQMSWPLSFESRPGTTHTRGHEWSTVQAAHTSARIRPVPFRIAIAQNVSNSKFKLRKSIH
jgi:hypothetical protein